MLELIDCWGELEETGASVVLAAAGKVFSSGHDLSEMVWRDINEYRRIFDVCTELMTKDQSIPQPGHDAEVRSGQGSPREQSLHRGPRIK